jgi:hypothetical protein
MVGRWRKRPLFVEQVVISVKVEVVMLEIIVPRVSAAESTFAIVKARYHSDDADVFKRALGDALTTWMCTTADGEKAWDDSVQDFNIGDLVHYDIGASSVLGGILTKAGIFDLSIDVYSLDGVDCHWHFDDVLGGLKVLV